MGLVSKGFSTKIEPIGIKDTIFVCTLKKSLQKSLALLTKAKFFDGFASIYTLLKKARQSVCF